MPESEDPIQAALDAADAADAAAAPPEPGSEAAPAPDAESAAQAEEERRYAGRYTSVEELERAHDELNRTFGSMGDRAGHAERRAQELEAQLNALQQQVQGVASGGYAPGTGERQFLPDGTPILLQEELADLAQEDPYTAARLEAKYEVERMRLQFEARLEERDAPLVSVVHDMSARTALETLKERIGPEMLEAHKDALRQVIESDPTHFADPQTQVARMEQAVYAAAYRAQNGQQSQPRLSNGQFASTEGGSGAAPGAASPAQNVDPEIEALRSYKPPSDAFGTIPGRR